MINTVIQVSLQVRQNGTDSRSQAGISVEGLIEQHPRGVCPVWRSGSGKAFRERERVGRFGEQESEEGRAQDRARKVGQVGIKN